jgi:hypothetical protein
LETRTYDDSHLKYFLLLNKQFIINEKRGKKVRMGLSMKTNYLLLFGTSSPLWK